MEGKIVLKPLFVLHNNNSALFTSTKLAREKQKEKVQLLNQMSRFFYTDSTALTLKLCKYTLFGSGQNLSLSIPPTISLSLFLSLLIQNYRY